MAIEVLTAGPDELADVLRLWSDARDEMVRLGRATAPVEQIAPRLEQGIRDGRLEVLLARREGRAVGFVVLRETPLSFLLEPSLSIDELFVAHEHRRHGVARAILTHVASRAEASGADQIVSSVNPLARETHRFFARLGFAPLTVRRAVAPAVLRRRLCGDAPRGALEDLLSRRRSMRARGRRRPLGVEEYPAGGPDAAAGWG
ncbi:GNAT family N-acetyltransferase [Spongisporangium articulatum]|uniref:GNAT family N-acetyltransferase n=1 Tax=Spongisporangium articulatum TaxID=3362603 RepID=A0ABW8ARE0_9ACTN